jgi:hypothetical protein
MRVARHRLRLSIACTAVLAFAIAVTAPAVAQATAPKLSASSPPAATAYADASLAGFICDQLEAPAATGAKALVSRLVGGGFDGGLAVSLVVKVAFTKCESAIHTVGSFLKRFLGIQRRPVRKQTASPTSQYLQYLDSYSAGLIASRLRPYSSVIRTSNDVFRFANALCYDATNSRDPGNTLAAFVPRANRSALPALNATVSLVLRRCSLRGFQRSYLSLGVTSYVLDRITHFDFDPPFAVVFNPTFSGKYANGSWATTVTWIGFDSTSGVRGFELWLRSNRSWQKIAFTQRTSWTLGLRPGFNVQFAIRAQDGAGNVSPFSYTGSYNT